MTRRKIIAANWKMNPMPEGALDHDSPYHPHAAIDIFVYPSFLDIPACVSSGITVGGQYGHPEPQGARTGDVSMMMLAKAKCRTVLCGHSERRNNHSETNEDVERQVIAAIEAGLHPIVCVGESAEVRKKGQKAVEKVLKEQIENLPVHSNLIIAYEPIWAIGKEAANPADAEAAHAFIRSILPDDTRDATRILYGGSVNAENAEAFLKEANIDGLLVGGASLKPEVFQAIVNEAIAQA